MKLKQNYSFIIKTFQKYNKNIISILKNEKTRGTQTQILLILYLP